MKNLHNYGKKVAYVVVAMASVLIWSCADEDTEVVTTTDTQNVQGESVTDSYYDESNDFSAIAAIVASLSCINCWYKKY